MNYREWRTTVPEEIRTDPLWRIEGYRLGLFLADIGWRDTTRLMRDRRTRALAAPLSQALASISKKLSDSYSHSSREERRRAYEAAESAVKQSQDMGMQEVDVFVKGPGPGREAAIRAIQAMGLKVRSISDVTPVPHNGCRPPKKRRV